MENIEKDCIGFPGNSNDIKEFFNQASVVNDIKTPKTKCSAEGVAKNGKGTIVDWRLFQGGVGYIVYKNETTPYVCKKGSKCCDALPHICNTHP
ncbi:MAG: hypothetical protein GWN00_05785 [Aliifodinibius sp.]|nr:hypothetical protein [Fodinibius sp.]NIY24335.1 hypothetical protein [Fodinibius sp.]